MFKKVIKGMLNSKSHYKKYSSSEDHYDKKRYGKHPSKYGHKYYKRKNTSSSRFFKSYSSS